ncbi:MAG: putative addiction module antidote protein [Synergistaceae bacterium]|nr:putative addiction module antidote protein [Synergistaceae bacterium]
MDDKKEAKLLALALTMPKHDDFVIERYRKDPEYARLMVQDEFQEYTETNDIRYLLSTLRKAAEARGWSALSRETGLSRSVLYAALSGERDPRIGTIMKILKALGIQVFTNIVPFPGKGSDEDDRTA